MTTSFLSLSLELLTAFLTAYFLVKNRLEKNKDKEYSYGIKFDDIFDVSVFNFEESLDLLTELGVPFRK